MFLLVFVMCGCSRTQDEVLLPWVKYRTVGGPGGSGIWSGSSHTEVLVRRWWGWSMVFDGNAAPGRPIVLTPAAVLIPKSGEGWLLTSSASSPSLACGDRKAGFSVPPIGRFVDCVDHLAGPAPAIAIALRVRRVDAAGKLIAQQEFEAGGPGRVFSKPAVSFYDDAGTPYLVTFRDPWAEEQPDGSQPRMSASNERLEQITCELITVGPNAPPALPAPPGHKIADCSTAEVWSRVLGRRLRDPW